MQSVHIAAAVFGLWLIVALPIGLWTTAWEMIAAASTRDVETPGISTRMKRSTDLAKLGGPAVLAVLAGAMVNFGVSWILSGDGKDQGLGVLLIFGSILLAMLGSVGIAWLLSAGGYSPNTFSALRADIKEGADRDRLEAQNKEWKGILERLESRMLLSVFQVTSSRTADDSTSPDFDAARLAFPEASRFKNFVTPKKAARTAEKNVLLGYSSRWPTRWIIRNWILGTSILAVGIPILAIVILRPEARYSASVLVLAVVLLTVGYFLNRLRKRTFVIASIRRHSIFLAQKQDCDELLEKSRAGVIAARLALSLAEPVARSGVAQDPELSRGIIRRFWNWLW